MISAGISLIVKLVYEQKFEVQEDEKILRKT